MRQFEFLSQEVIAWHDLKYGKLAEDDDEEIVDIGQNLGRTPRCSAAAPCVTPNALLWARKRQRLLEGVEVMALQGYPHFDLESVSNIMSPANFTNLAGNAFCGYNMLAIAIAQLSAYEWPLLKDSRHGPIF